MNHRNFYIPRLDELENYCEKTNNCPVTIKDKCNSSGNTICINGTSPDECCGNYILNLPRNISNLNFTPLGLSSLLTDIPKTTILNGSSLKLTYFDNCILYDIVFNDFQNSAILTSDCCPSFIPCWEGYIKIKINASIVFEHKSSNLPKEKMVKQVTNINVTQKEITTIVFNDEIKLFPYKTSNGLTKEKMIYISSVDNRALMFIKYVYINKEFQIDFIAIHLAIDVSTTRYL